MRTCDTRPDAPPALPPAPNGPPPGNEPLPSHCLSDGAKRISSGAKRMTWVSSAPIATKIAGARPVSARTRNSRPSPTSAILS